jgi:hypothetical protein
MHRVCVQPLIMLLIMQPDMQAVVFAHLCVCVCVCMCVCVCVWQVLVADIGKDFNFGSVVEGVAELCGGQDPCIIGASNFPYLVTKVRKVPRLRNTHQSLTFQTFHRPSLVQITSLAHITCTYNVTCADNITGADNISPSITCADN